MAVRRVRIILAVVALWILGSWYYVWAPAEGPPRTSPFSPLADGSIQYGEASEDIRWKKPPARYPVKKLTPLPTKQPAAPIPKVQATKPEEDEAAENKRLKRLAAVKASFQHSWGGYKKYGWLKDEVTPVSGNYKNPFGGWAATLVDSLDTLWIMGLETDFTMAVKACDYIDFTTTQAKDINVFETTIRYLGGFLAAYELSGKKHSNLLAKAKEVGELLMGAFDTPNHMPVSRWNWRKYLQGEDQTAPRSTLVSEIGSLSMEFSKLSQLTGDMTYHDAAQRISDQIELGQSKTYLPGMWPVVLDASKTPIEFTGETFTLGGMSDSLYEYFPKQYALLGGMLDQPRKQYEGFIDVAKRHLFRRALNPENVPILFSGDARVKSPNDEDREVVTTARAQHLTCFAGGMVALAAKVFDRPADMDVAVQLTDGCVWSYSATTTGIGPEIFNFIACDSDSDQDDCQWTEKRWYESLKKHWRKGQKGVTDEAMQAIVDGRKLPKGMLDINDRKYILRPEAIESVFLMYRMTGDAVWMDKAWDMFIAIEKYTHTSVAAASLDDVTREKPYQMDSMESFWLAETLKYFYLVFSEWDVVDLDKWVLNTEAHPLRRMDAD
ncbi:putative Glycoside hydrolase [Seiridium cardinale]|uniref:alpha-1,2-Mannosidase n=1 Tax=Seiridium cardinale TaxID=138064 RepID=A0ABR2XKU3_9PEZI